MGLVVQKFGGTSVETIEGWKAILNHVCDCRAAGNDVVVVVSAMGRKGAPYATDTLIHLLEEIDPHIDLMKKDFLISCGEIISAAILSHYFEVHKLDAIPMTGFQAGILTNSKFNDADILNIDTQAIKKRLEEGKIIVIAGFQGITANGLITTLGRGGSDTTAVELGAYLQADRVDIFTDVPGVAVTDPRIVSNVSYLSHISYENMYKLASNGTKVIHPRAVKAAQKSQIPVFVRSTFSDNPGTRITNSAECSEQSIVGISYDKDFSYIRVKASDKILYDQLKTFSLFIKETDQHIEAYYKVGSRIDGNPHSNLSMVHARENLSKVTIFYGEKNSDYIHNEILHYLKQSTFPILDSFSFNDHVAIMLPDIHLEKCIQEIYSHLDTISQNLATLS
ncbi:aspartate kinase [Geosporobacter ferrireducens]|uniref:Aspartokinase n=1 Tax=Geosporobacter ferrireducens TaxID=1424294 RepID=A0A1D8GP18_9FIRM|nr:aspartate kinase [Geosporobacter ferrireducens]AOT72643.1 hypothetical protein Gferi_25665 [Geosporobacter ferrireducens]MTI55047.1 aspartate kinase [Geosporobacter ferrireducens]